MAKKIVKKVTRKTQLGPVGVTGMAGPPGPIGATGMPGTALLRPIKGSSRSLDEMKTLNEASVTCTTVINTCTALILNCAESDIAEGCLFLNKENDLDQKTLTLARNNIARATLSLAKINEKVDRLLVRK